MDYSNDALVLVGQTTRRSPAFKGATALIVDQRISGCAAKHLIRCVNALNADYAVASSNRHQRLTTVVDLFTTLFRGFGMAHHVAGFAAALRPILGIRESRVVRQGIKGKAGSVDEVRGESPSGAIR